MREVKKPEVRREEFMNAAKALFDERGVDPVSVNDIITRVGVAKGTFYWHFKSKEALLDALAERKIRLFIDRIQPIAADDRLGAVDKLRGIFAGHDSACQSHRCLADYFHRPENMSLHQKHRALERERLCPLLATILSQGVDEGVFATAYPETAADFLIMALTILVHPPRDSQGQDQATRRRGIQDVLERALGAAHGTLDFFLDVRG